MFGLHPRLVGIILMCVAGALLITAGLIGWNAVQRWQAINHITDSHIARLAGRASSAKESAEAAAALLPDDAMATLPALDPADDGAGPRLERLARAVHPRDRAIVATTAAFSAALRGSDAEAIDGADGLLIKHLTALAKGGLPPFPTLPANDAPQLAILVQAAQQHAAAAWKAGNRDQLIRGLGMVLLARPTHAEAKAMATLLTAFEPRAEKAQLANLIGGLGPEGLALARRAALLMPERAPQILAVIPSAQRTPEEEQRILAAGGEQGESLDSLVQKGLASPSPALLASLFRRCLDQDKVDLARQIADKAVEPQRRDLQAALANHIGDALALAALHPERSDLKPTTSPPVGRPGVIAFHLATGSGLVPRVGELHARVDGKAVPATSIKRWGSLVVLLLPGSAGNVDLDIKLGDTTVFAGGVRL